MKYEENDIYLLKICDDTNIRVLNEKFITFLASASSKKINERNQSDASGISDANYASSIE